MVSAIGIIREKLSKAVEFVPVSSVLFLDESISQEWDILENKADILNKIDAAYAVTIVEDEQENVYCTDDAIKSAAKVASVLPHCIVRLKSVFYHLGMAESRCDNSRDCSY